MECNCHIHLCHSLSTSIRLLLHYLSKKINYVFSPSKNTKFYFHFSTLVHAFFQKFSYHFLNDFLKKKYYY
jgi:hypothetical protein